MYAERHTVTLTTNSSGAAEAYTPVVTGKIVSIAYVKTDFADGVDFTVAGETSGLTIWAEENVNASAVRAPRQPIHLNSTGAPVVYGTDLPVVDDIVVANERIKVAVANGGNGKTGTVHITVA